MSSLRSRVFAAFALAMALNSGFLAWSGALHAAESPAHPASVQGRDQALIDLMVQRLELAREVAWTKYRTGAAVYDGDRERVLLKNLVAMAEKAGLSRSVATEFFSAQIAASRAVQTELIEGWKNGRPKPVTRPLDLQKEIRPSLDRVSEQLVAALAAQPTWSAGTALLDAAHVSLRSHGFSPAAAQLAVGGLAGSVSGAP